MKKWILLLLIMLAIMGTTMAFAQPSLPAINTSSELMVVFYNKGTGDVLGYALYNDNLVISSDGVKSDNINLSGINWAVVNYELYKYQDIPQKYVGGVPVSWKLSELNLQPITASELPHSQHIAVLKAINISAVKPVTVTRRFMGIDYNVQCLVSQGVVSLWQAGKVAIGDYVIVSFITEQPNSTEYMIPIVVDKVYKSW